MRRFCAGGEGAVRANIGRAESGARDRLGQASGQTQFHDQRLKIVHISTRYGRTQVRDIA